MGLYRYETHLHTTEASACAYVGGADHVKFYKDAGYTGIIVTDHFFNGNTNISRTLPWEERVELFCRGYENAKVAGDQVGLSVFFGWEANFRFTEFLIYGLDKQWLKKHPDMLSWTMEEHYQRIHADGGYVVHAHPFRERSYIKEVRLFPDLCDAVEVINVGNKSEAFDNKAFAYASKHKLAMSAGTDAHGADHYHSGIAVENKIENINDFIDIIKTGRCELIKPR